MIEPLPIVDGALFVSSSFKRYGQIRINRFLKKVNVNGPIQKHVAHLGRCWKWCGATCSQRRGVFYNGKRMILAHRFSFELFYGQFNNSLDCCHHCDNPNCVNPKHLFIGTTHDNVEDARKKGRLTYTKVCPKGHVYSRSGRIYYDEKGHYWKVCRICERAAKKRYKQRKALGLV